LAVNIVNEKQLSESSTVVIGCIANRIVHVDLSTMAQMIELFEESHGKGTYRSPSCMSHTEVGMKHPCLAQQHAMTPVASKLRRLFELAALTAL
jgi:hypothetical protein